jgi:hypothetical protein
MANDSASMSSTILVTPSNSNQMPEKRSTATEREIMNEDLVEVAIALSEVALDALTDNEIIKDIPIIGIFVRLARATMSISDRIFAKKVERFISVIDSIPRDKRDQFHARLETQPDLRRKAGEVLVLTLDRVEDLQKAAITGKLFSHFITGDIPFDTLRRLLVGVDRAFIDDLLSFPEWALQGRFADGFDPQSLDGTGLVEPVYPVFGDVPANKRAAPTFGYSKLGEVYARLLLGFQP